MIIIIFLCDQVSDDDSYVSDVSDSTSVEFCRNENGNVRENFGEALSNPHIQFHLYEASPFFAFIVNGLCLCYCF